MKTTTATVRITIDQAFKLNESEMNLSEFVRDKLEEHFNTENFYDIKEQLLMTKLAKVKLQKENSKKAKAINMSNYERSILIEAKDKMKNNPKYAAGQLCIYNNSMNKKIDIDKFLELLEKV